MKTILPITMPSSNRSSSNSAAEAFTLVELLIVMLIIAVGLAIVVPYAGKSQKNIRFRQEVLNMTEAIRYAIDTAVSRKRPAEFVIDGNDNSYFVRIESGDADSYKPVAGFIGEKHKLFEGIRICDAQGFETDNNLKRLVFDPGKVWPNAEITLANDESSKTIKINGVQVEPDETQDSPILGAK